MFKGNKIVEMRQAAINFVTNVIPNGSEIGIVSFSTRASVVANLQLVDGRRDLLETSISSLLAGGGTCIGCGINEGIEVMITVVLNL